MRIPGSGQPDILTQPGAIGGSPGYAREAMRE